MLIQYDPDRLKEAKDDLGSLLGILREPGSLWHRCSVPGFKSMLNGGFLLPSGSGPEPTYDQTRISVAKRLGGISLFDFATADENDVLDQWINWGPFFGDRGIPTLVLKFEKAKLEEVNLFTQERLTSENIWPLRRLDPEDECKAYHIYAVEAWYVGKLPMLSLEGALVMRGGRPKKFDYFSAAHLRSGVDLLLTEYEPPTPPSSISKLVSEWCEKNRTLRND